MITRTVISTSRSQASTPLCLRLLPAGKRSQNLRRSPSSNLNDNHDLNNVGTTGGNQRPQQRRRDGQPLYDAKWVRVVEHDLSEGVVTGFTEDTVIPCRIAIETDEALLPSMRISRRWRWKRVAFWVHSGRSSHGQDVEFSKDGFSAHHSVVC